MKKNIQKLLAVFLTTMIMVVMLVMPASAASAKTNSKEALYPLTDPLIDVTFKAVDLFTEAVNAAAGIYDTWSEEDGQCIENIAYGNRGRNVYDLYIPNGLNKAKKQKAILFIHGGAWTQGSKSNMSSIARMYAKKGYITATMSYDLLPDSSGVAQVLGADVVAHGQGSKANATIYDILGDVKKCIQSIKDETKGLGYEVNGLALSGVSAGAHIALLFAYGKSDKSAIPIKCAFVLTAPSGFYKDSFNNMTVEETASYAALVSGTKMTEAKLLNPNAKQKAILDSISPVAKIKRSTVPTFFGYAGKDKTIGTAHWSQLEPVLKRYGVPHDIIWFPNSDHTLLNDPGVMETYLNGATNWLAKYM